MVPSPISLPLTIDHPNLARLYEQAQRAGNIQDMMAISNFLNPIEKQEIQENEEEDLNSEKVLQDVLSEHLGLQQDEEEDEAEQQSAKPQRPIQDAIQALQVVIEFAEGREDMETAQLRAIERVEQKLKSLDRNSRIQGTLDGWMIYSLRRFLDTGYITSSYRD